jgi:hypothetical protein
MFVHGKDNRQKQFEDPFCKSKVAVGVCSIVALQGIFEEVELREYNNDHNSYEGNRK